MKQMTHVRLVGSLVVALIFLTAGTQPAISIASYATIAQPTMSTDSTLQATTTKAASNNPFGILIGLNSLERSTVVKSLGIAFFRPNQAVVIEQWGGDCADCDQALQMGLRLILTVRANGGGPQNPSSAPNDLVAYQKTVAGILAKYRPEVLAVENEENSTIFYTSTPQEYGAELNAACEVAHRQGIKCTNGGMVSDDVALLVWGSIFEQSGSIQACDFAKRTFRPNRIARVCGIKSLDQLPASEKESLDKDKALLQVYKTSRADYMNFHWYISDSQALQEAANFLQGAVGLPLMSNEMGQQDDNPTTVTALLSKSIELKLAYVIWFSGNQTQKDANNADKVLQPTPLINNDNTLRSTGEAFKTFLKEHFN